MSDVITICKECMDYIKQHRFGMREDVRSGMKDVQVTLKCPVKTNPSFRLSQALQSVTRLWW
jgi:hypothetical protein